MTPTPSTLRFAAVGLLLAGCQPSIYFETESKGATTVQGSVLGGLLAVFPQAAALTNIDVTQSQDFQNQGVRKEDVKSVMVKRLVLQVTSPSDADFQWLSSIRFFAETDGQKDLIAFKEGIDQLGLVAPNPRLELELADVELKPYVVAPSMSITTEASGRQPPKDTTIEATVRLGVDAVIIK
ncbi:MAG: hypothetical protein ACOZIN_07220 [Myxococcota bacterium]